MVVPSNRWAYLASLGLISKRVLAPISYNVVAVKLTPFNWTEVRLVKFLSSDCLSTLAIVDMRTTEETSGGLISFPNYWWTPRWLIRPLVPS